MRTTYQLRSGRRRIGVREAWSADDAALEYVRSLGCPDEEIVCLGAGAVSWRGAVYRAERAPDGSIETRRPVGAR